MTVRWIRRLCWPSLSVKMVSDYCDTIDRCYCCWVASVVVAAAAAILFVESLHAFPAGKHKHTATDSATVRNSNCDVVVVVADADCGGDDVQMRTKRTTRVTPLRPRF